MGMYLDPGNESFKSDLAGDIYIDKTEMLSFLNRYVATPRRYFAVSRARRFGKSMAAGMLDAYYSIGCDSETLFQPYAIAKDKGFHDHLNKYHVLHIDMATFLNAARKDENPVDLMNDTVMRDFKDMYPELINDSVRTLPKAVEEVWRNDGIGFVIIIDEWECIIREAGNDEELIMYYLKYLRGFFKTEESKKFLALGYLTGILPIKKFNGESAMNNFIEYTMISPKSLAPYFGFSEDEIIPLLDKYGVLLDEIRKWYDGYIIATPGQGWEPDYVHMYNPNSIVDALTFRSIESYWKNTGAFTSLNDYIAINMDGLKYTVLRLLSGESCHVDTSGFQNDLTSFKSKDDVLTALIHMGYLGYDPRTEEAFIPNEEVREVFSSAIKVGDWTEIAEALRDSDDLLKATWAGDEIKVAMTIEKSHQDYTSILEYHDENSLALAIMMSYYTARKHYMIIREFPSGKGFADIAFIPRKGSDKPAMIVELKWNDDADTAIDQIKDRKYTGKLKDYGSDILLVGISYDKINKTYSCKIVKP